MKADVAGLTDQEGNAMAKKATGKTKHPVEILDDNGTLIAAGADAPGKTARGADVSVTDKRGIPKP